MDILLALLPFLMLALSALLVLAFVPRGRTQGLVMMVVLVLNLLVLAGVATIAG